jgi:hypothetical protein
VLPNESYTYRESDTLESLTSHGNIRLDDGRFAARSALSPQEAEAADTSGLHAEAATDALFIGSKDDSESRQRYYLV